MSRLKLWLHATDRTYVDAISEDPNDGRIPMARFTWGFVTGRGWGFLRPWEQKALFPAKGTPLAFGDPYREHEAFWILRWRSFEAAFRHPNHDYDIEGRYWYGWVWRRSWGKWWQFWRARWELLDPDVITHDPGKADDWGARPGEDW